MRSATLPVAAALAVALLAACSSKPRDKAAGAGARATADGGAIDAAPRRADGTVALPPAPPVPATPPGLPPLPGDVAPTPAEVALGELLFHEPKLGADGTTACASCHDPARGLSGTEPHPATAAGRPSLRRAPALVNLAWATELGWDGRGAGLAG